MRKPRTKFSPDQLQALELEYQMDPFLSTSADKRADLAKKLNITEKNVQIWFQVKWILHRNPVIYMAFVYLFIFFFFWITLLASLQNQELKKKN